MTKKKIKVVGIYSGAGGLELGFHKAGFTNVFSTDNWKPACESLVANKISEDVLCEDIRRVNFKKIKAKHGVIDCLIGGPPCPAYSKSRFYLKNKKRALEDENSFTLNEYFRALKELSPTVFVFENVFGFVYKPHKDAFDFLLKKTNELGYEVSYKVINCADYGIPQMRERFFCVGVKRGLGKFRFPDPTHQDSNESNLDLRRKPWVGTGEVLGDIDFDLPEDSKMQAGSKHKHLLKLIPPGENYLYFTRERGYPKPLFKWRSRYWSFLLKLSPKYPSWTIQASHSNNMGPFHWKNRFLRISEIKRIQTFDDDYILIGDFKTQWRQVGNAVPPKMAQILANAILKQYFNNRTPARSLKAAALFEEKNRLLHKGI
jgi:DNA (cytosine-5)-methyltransferase 1